MKKLLTKTISVSLTVALLISLFSTFAFAAGGRNLDLAFVIDTTGSMSDDINEVKNSMAEYLEDLNASKMNWRVALIDYRDFASRTGYSEDYPYKVQLDFSSNYDEILNAINNLSLGGGGDNDETICSALIDGLDELSWRTGLVGKAAILMGDAPALDPEPYTGYTKDAAIKKLTAGKDIGYTEEPLSVMTLANEFAYTRASDRGAVTLFTIATSDYSDTVSDFEYLATKTGGESYIASDSEEISDIISDIIDIIPDVVEDVKPSFWDRIARFFQVLWYIITFQWGKI